MFPKSMASNAAQNTGIATCAATATAATDTTRLAATPPMQYSLYGNFPSGVDGGSSRH